MAVEPGDLVEFWSGDRGGCWKPGVVDQLFRNNGRHLRNVRIKVGSDVCIIRSAEKVRLRRPRKTA